MGLVEVMKRGVKRGGLARARRTGDEYDAIRRGDEPLEFLLVVRQETQLRHPELEAFLVENAHDDALTVRRGQRRHAQVQRAAVNVDLDAAVLRHALLGDTDVRHDFQARDDGELPSLRRRLHLEQQAIDAVAHAEAALERFKVDVRRATADGLGDDGLHELDDGCVAVARLPFLRPGDGHGGSGGGIQGARGRLVAQQFVHGLALPAIVAGDGAGDVIRRGQRRLDLAPCDVAKAVDDIHRERVGHGNLQHPARTGIRHDAVFLHEGAWQRGEDFARDLQ